MANWSEVTEALSTELSNLFRMFATDASADLQTVAKEIASDMTAALREGRSDIQEHLLTQLQALEETYQIKLAKEATFALDRILGVIFKVLSSALVAI